MMSIQDLIEKVSCLCRKVEVLRVQNRTVSPASDNYVISKNEGVVIIPTAAANARDVILPNPVIWKNRRITIVNYSGNTQNILSHDSGTSLTIKTTNSSNVGTLAIANSALTTTADSRFTFISNGTVWVLIGA